MLIGQAGLSSCLSKKGDLRFDARPDTSAKTNFGALSMLPVDDGSDSLDCLNAETRPVDEDGFTANGFTFGQLDEGLVEYRDGVVLLVGGEGIEHNFTMTGTGTVIPSGGDGSTSTLLFFHYYELRPRGGGGRPKNGCSASGNFIPPIEVVITETAWPTVCPTE